MGGCRRSKPHPVEVRGVAPAPSPAGSPDSPGSWGTSFPPPHEKDAPVMQRSAGGRAAARTLPSAGRPSSHNGSASQRLLPNVVIPTFRSKGAVTRDVRVIFRSCRAVRKRDTGPFSGSRSTKAESTSRSVHQSGTEISGVCPLPQSSLRFSGRSGHRVTVVRLTASPVGNEGSAADKSRDKGHGRGRTNLGTLHGRCAWRG